MTYIKRLQPYLQPVWHYFLGEPFTWLFYCFFQPRRFSREFDFLSNLDFFKHFKPLLRLLLPMFLISYPLALIIRVIIISATGEVSGPPFHIISFLVTTA